MAAMTKSYESVLVGNLDFLVPVGFERVMLPVFGDLDFRDRCAGVINYPEIPLGHSRCLEGVKERSQQQHYGSGDGNPEAKSQMPPPIRNPSDEFHRKGEQRRKDPGAKLRIDHHRIIARLRLGALLIRSMNDAGFVHVERPPARPPITAWHRYYHIRGLRFR